MKFRMWLQRLEENQRNRGLGGNPDMTTGLGPTSQYGRRAMMPVSWGLDNRAVAGVIDGIGDARSKIRARKGAEPGVASQYHGLEDIRRDGFTSIYMPLQLPHVNLDRGNLIQKTRGLVQSLKGLGDPLADGSYAWRVDPDDNVSLLRPKQDESKLPNRLYDRQTEASRVDSAINYTTALMEASIAVRLRDYSDKLNTDAPQIKDRKIQQFATEQDGKKISYEVMMCSFVIKSKHKGEQMTGDVRDEIERILSGEEPKTKPAPPPTPTPPPTPAPTS